MDIIIRWMLDRHMGVDDIKRGLKDGSTAGICVVMGRLNVVAQAVQKRFVTVMEVFDASSDSDCAWQF
jgi:hypothetical protein